jgi:hypothetical protein
MEKEKEKIPKSNSEAFGLRTGGVSEDQQKLLAENIYDEIRQDRASYEMDVRLSLDSLDSQPRDRG